MCKIKHFFIGFLLFMAANVVAQETSETFIIDGDTLQLQREVTGPLSLFWNETGHTYRYFVQKGDRLVELKNEKNNQEYKEQLAKLTSDAKIKARDVFFVLYSLRHFVNRYNALVEEDYEFNDATDNIQNRLGLFLGLSNNKYTENPEDILAPIAGVEFEFYDPNLAPRHAAFLQLRQSFRQEGFRYTSTQLSINYRFRALYFSGFDFHINTKLATFLYAEENERLLNDAGEVVAIKENNGFTFTAPFSFGVGSDIQITDRGFITVGYNDIFSLVLDGNDSFPIDFTLGYKFNL